MCPKRLPLQVRQGAFGAFSVIRPGVRIDYLHVDNATQALRLDDLCAIPEEITTNC